MTKEHSFVAGDYSDRDLYASSRTQERALNSVIVRAEISKSFEEYLEIFEAFYAERHRGKQRNRGRTDSWKGQSALALGQLPGSASRDVQNRWPIDIHPTDRDSWRSCRRDAFRVDARPVRDVRQDLYCDLVGPPPFRLTYPVSAKLQAARD